MASAERDESKETETPAKRSWQPMELAKVGTFGDVMLGAMTSGNDGGVGHMN
jgi:hypothetical protein